MANMEDSNDESDFILVRRKNTMKRGKPLQQLYRPGSGPLKKSNTLEDSESDTNISITSRNNQIKKASVDSATFKSESSSPRERSTYVADEVTPHSEAMSNSDTTRRQKKPEKEIYVPRIVAQAREVISSQNSKNDSFHNSNGNEFNDRSTSNTATSSDQHRNYLDRRNNMGIDDERHEWREQSAPRNRHRQGIEQRAGPNGGGGAGEAYHRARARDPHGAAPGGRPAGERLPPRPPAGRRHSAAGVEPPERRRGIDHLPPRLQRKFLAESGARNAAVEEWDGSSVTFQAHAPPPGGASFHPVGGGGRPRADVGVAGYHTLPSRPRGRGRFNTDYETMPGHIYGLITPDAGPSPANSRPPSPPRRSDSRPHTPVNQSDMKGPRQEFYGGRPDSRPQTPVNVNREYQDRKGPIGKQGNQDRRGNNRRRDNGNRRYNDYDINNKDNWETESHDSYNTRRRDREIGNRTEDLGSMDRDKGNWDRDVGDKNRDMGNWNRDVGDKNRDIGNWDKDVGDKNRDMGNWDRDVGDKNREMGNWDKDVVDKNRDSGNRNRDIGNRNRDTGNRNRDNGNRNRDVGNRNRDIGNWDRDNGPRDRDLDNTNREPGRRDRDVGNRDKDVAPRDRDAGNKRDQGASGKRGRGSFRERRRDSRRDRDRRGGGGGRNFVAPQEDENWDEEEVETQNSEFKPSVERQLSPVMSEKFEATIQINTQILDWSEEVELNDRLEAEYHSDAMTRSSSVISLQEISTKSLPSNMNNTPSSRKNKRNDARENTRDQRSRQNSTTSIDSRDGFKAPYDSFSRKKSRDRREDSFDRYHNSSRNISRDSSWDRQQPASGNWRDEMVKRNAENGDKVRNIDDIKNVDSATKKAGVLVLPQQKPSVGPPKLNAEDHPRHPDGRKPAGQQKTLFDPNNPSRPILVRSPGARAAAPGFGEPVGGAPPPPQLGATDQFGNALPKWYDEGGREFRSCHYPDLIRDVKRADGDLQVILKSGLLLVNWDMVDKLRQFLKEALQYLICKAIKFCELGNIEQHFWKILYHNIIEVTRKAFKDDPENKGKYKAFLLYLIDEGTKYFEGLLPILEETYNFKLNNFLKENNMASHKDLKLVGLALVSAQKICLFLGDLGRYREEVNETSNYGMCRQWYIKSHEINPKNGRPYNQLAILAVYARRKLDAVYYYMRSLMSTNPVPSARENLTSLFDENRKKYEQGERRRREDRLERRRAQLRREESEGGAAQEGGDGRPLAGSLRQETWVHPEGGRRVRRTTSGRPEDSDEEDLAGLTSVEVNKRFVISYLHVHGKLITNIGMESFQETAMQMLKEFRALLQHSPVPLPCNRFLQLLALNMFAIDSTQLKDPHLQSQPGYRSELQERALVVSLQMFNLILERCVRVLREHLEAHKDAPVAFLPQDANVLLPAVKIWCDWMLCHTDIWNPPPSTRDFRIGHPGDAWSRLATLMNLLEKIDQPAAASFIKHPKEGYEPVWLPEDSVLSGFTPLTYSISADPTYAPADLDLELAHASLRLARLLFFGTVYLCGVEPPVLKLEIEDGHSEYVSVVSTSASSDSPPVVAVRLEQDNDVLLESFSEDEIDEQKEQITANASNEIRDLLTRKVELEKRERSQDLHMQRVKKILSQSVVSVHMEIRPKYLVPDTNCFIDHLDGISTIAQSNCYTLMVPTVVLGELEGLSRGGRTPIAPGARPPCDAPHARRVAACAKAALDFVRARHPSVKCVTTRGAVLASAACSTEEEDVATPTAAGGGGATPTNDDKILGTCLVLCRGRQERQADVPDVPEEGEPRRLLREVVLLTDDRNLRVKAHARDLPVRELPDFAAWAGLG